MKHITKEIKAELWRLFDSGHKFTNITINGCNVPAEAVEKQRALWEAHRRRRAKSA